MAPEFDENEYQNTELHKKLNKPLISKPNFYFHKGLLKLATKREAYPKLLQIFIDVLTVIFFIASLPFDIAIAALALARGAIFLVKNSIEYITSLLTGRLFTQVIDEYRGSNKDLLNVKVSEEIINTFTLKEQRRAVRLNTDFYIDDLDLAAQYLFERAKNDQELNLKRFKLPWKVSFDRMYERIALDLLPTFKLVNKSSYLAISAKLPKNIFFAFLDILLLRTLRIATWPVMLAAYVLITAVHSSLKWLARPINLLGDIFILLPAMLFSLPLYVKDFGRWLMKKSKNDTEEYVMAATTASEDGLSYTNMLLRFDVTQAQTSVQKAVTKQNSAVASKVTTEVPDAKKTNELTTAGLDIGEALASCLNNNRY